MLTAWSSVRHCRDVVEEETVGGRKLLGLCFWRVNWELATVILSSPFLATVLSALFARMLVNIRRVALLSLPLLPADRGNSFLFLKMMCSSHERLPGHLEGVKRM